MKHELHWNRVAITFNVTAIILYIIYSCLWNEYNSTQIHVTSLCCIESEYLTIEVRTPTISAAQWTNLITCLVADSSDRLAYQRWPSQHLYSLSGWTSYSRIAWNHDAEKLGVTIIVSLRNWTGTSAEQLPSYLTNFIATYSDLNLRISRLPDFTRSSSKTPLCFVNRNPTE